MHDTVLEKSDTEESIIENQQENKHVNDALNKKNMIIRFRMFKYYSVYGGCVKRENLVFRLSPTNQKGFVTCHCGQITNSYLFHFQNLALPHILCFIYLANLPLSAYKNTPVRTSYLLHHPPISSKS